MRGAAARRKAPGGRALVAATVLTASLAAAGCTSYTGSPANQIREWAQQADVTANDAQLVADLGDFRRSVARGQLGEVTTNCAGLATDAGTADGNLPTPDNALTNQLNDAYEQFFNAGNDCAQATIMGSSRIVRANQRLTRGLAELRTAERKLRQAGVH